MMTDQRVFRPALNHRQHHSHQPYPTFTSHEGCYDHHQQNGNLNQDIHGNAERERSRVKTLRGAFLELQRTLPAVPPDTKLSKLDVLVLATTYIAHLMKTLNNDSENQIFAKNGILHPVKKWPMRSRLYAGILSSTFPISNGGFTPSGVSHSSTNSQDCFGGNEYSIDNRDAFYRNQYTQQNISTYGEYQNQNVTYVNGITDNNTTL